MLKVREAMSSSGNNPMDGSVHIDEFVLGGKEQGKVGRSYNSKKKKAVTAIQLTDDGKVKRMYAMKIDDFSAQSLQYIFINHISRDAQVTTDLWRGYRPIAKVYNIPQVESNRGLNLKALHTLIHQVKSWIRTIYSWVIDHNLMVKMVKADKIYQTEFISN